MRETFCFLHSKHCQLVVGIGVACLMLVTQYSLVKAATLDTHGSEVADSQCPEFFLPLEAIDLGRVPVFSEQLAIFPFANNGKAPLKIEKINVSCGCTVVSPSSMLLNPGEEGKITVLWKIEDRRTGPLKRSVFVSSNDCSRPKITLDIHGEVYAEIEIYPHEISFGQLRNGYDVEREGKMLLVRRVGNEAKGADIQLESTSAHLMIQPPKIDEWGAEVYSIGLAEGIPEGIYAEKIILRTSLERLPEVSIPVSFSIVPDFRLIPDAFFLGTVQPGNSFEKEIRVVDDGTSPVELISVSCYEKGLSVKISKASEPGKYKLILTFDSKFDRKKRQGRIAIKTNNPHKNELEIPYFLHFK